MFGQLQRMLLKKHYYMHIETERQRKETFKSLWIMRINAAAHQHGLTYSEFMFKLKTNKISLNRKVLADLAMNNPNAFEAIVKSLK